MAFGDSLVNRNRSPLLPRWERGSDSENAMLSLRMSARFAIDALSNAVLSFSLSPSYFSFSILEFHNGTDGMFYIVDPVGLMLSERYVSPPQPFLLIKLFLENRSDYRVGCVPPRRLLLLVQSS